MRKPGRILLLLAACAAGPACAQSSTPAPAAREIEALIAALGRSNCEFQRNGRWHGAAEAQAHLRRKYEWLRRRDLAGSAEQFIERAGSRSSTTGQPYRVRCPGQPETGSAQWLRARLAESRHPAR
ncbi:DUF5329 domain-containing protein [Vulcaniibacterium tengchongense]|uniref:DUF5329 domain-containing protein n=1 Tax=Vulcaniibacterium tengchongense TaxID=1273429 RepID=A0A3N4VJ48_9GAMM|nr:DUF5329 domain-containing protein [Vulcaniibacterium tengchongense]RPE81445.1 hypothetical protein EDC50_0635 [Vulcaniibacterium tengchongense]